MGKVIVFGAGLSGLGAKELLEKKGFEVYLVDDKNGISSEEGIRVINSEKIDFIVKSPGISWKVDLLQEAAKTGIEVISEIDLAYKYMNKGIKIIGITGTNGKTTTATKIYELLIAADLKVALAGNAGYSFAKLVADEIDLQYIVLELSSYQLENNPKVHPFIAGNINLTPDHLMRYEDADDYYITKFNIFNNQDENDYILINADDNEFERISEVLEERAKLNVKQRKVFLSKSTIGTVFVFESKVCVMKNMNEKIDNFIYENNDRIDKIVNEKAEIIIDIDEISLKGNHNLENALFIIGTGKILNIPNEVIAQFLKTTKALEHRLENFFLKKNTLFVNDSKGTNVAATITAMSALPGTKVIILGGQGKGEDYAPLAAAVKKYTKSAVIIGSEKEKIAKALDEAGFEKYVRAITMEEAVRAAYAAASAGDTVLLSPACTSWDMYPNYGARGDDFCLAARKIISEEA